MRAPDGAARAAGAWAQQRSKRCWWYCPTCSFKRRERSGGGSGRQVGTRGPGAPARPPSGPRPTGTAIAPATRKPHRGSRTGTAIAPVTRKPHRGSRTGIAMAPATRKPYRGCRTGTATAPAARRFPALWRPARAQVFAATLPRACRRHDIEGRTGRRDHADVTRCQPEGRQRQDDARDQRGRLARRPQAEGDAGRPRRAALGQRMAGAAAAVFSHTLEAGRRTPVARRTGRSGSSSTVPQACRAMACAMRCVAATSCSSP